VHGSDGEPVQAETSSRPHVRQLLLSTASSSSAETPLGSRPLARRFRLERRGRPRRGEDCSGDGKGEGPGFSLASSFNQRSRSSGRRRRRRSVSMGRESGCVICSDEGKSIRRRNSGHLDSVPYKVVRIATAAAAAHLASQACRSYSRLRRTGRRRLCRGRGGATPSLAATPKSQTDRQQQQPQRPRRHLDTHGQTLERHHLDPASSSTFLEEEETTAAIIKGPEPWQGC
jgi:hypothetical protein